MKKWEYCVVRCASDDVAYLNGLGQKGWELISVKKPAGFAEFHFKRPIKEQDNDK